MLEKSLGLLFLLKKPKTAQQKGRYVYLRIMVNGISRELSTKRIWYADRWSPAAGRATGSKEDAKNLNAYLETLLHSVYQCKRHLLESEQPVTADRLKD